MPNIPAPLPTLRNVARAHVRPLVLKIAEHRTPGGFAIVNLTIERRRRRLVATLTAFHRDPEGTFTEDLDATPLLDRVGERALADELAAYTFDSGLSAMLNRIDDLVAYAPELLD